MGKYAVDVEEILRRTVIVEAESIEEAMDIVAEAIAYSRLVLTSADYCDREITLSDYWDGGKVPSDEDVSRFYHLEQ